MATRLGLVLCLLVALAIVASCADDDDAATPGASISASPTATPLFGECMGDLPAGPVALIGHVLGVSPSGPETARGFENVVVRISIVTYEVTPDPGVGDDRLQKFLRDPDVILLGDSITDVKIGDCVRVAGREETWACGPDCEDVGFVASFFEVQEAP